MNKLLITLLASVVVAGPHTRGDSGLGLYAPSHYLSDYHPDVIGLDEANAKAEAAGYENWAKYMLPLILHKEVDFPKLNINHQISRSIS